MAHLVRGEASESDDESLNSHSKIKPIAFAVELSGEATESDEDSKHAATEEHPTTSSIDTLHSHNLLQRKLIENNISIWKNLNVFTKDLTTNALKTLTKTDQALMKSQVSLQSALSSLKVANENIKLLHEHTSDLLAYNFIPYKTIKNNM